MLRKEYISPFGLLNECDKDSLLNLSSGVPVNDNLADGILSTISVGEKLAVDFRRERQLSTEKMFHGAIASNKMSCFSMSQKASCHQ